MKKDFATLYEAVIAYGEEKFADEMKGAMLEALASLGSDVYKIDWANSSARIDFAKAA